MASKNSDTGRSDLPPTNDNTLIADDLVDPGPQFRPDLRDECPDGKDLVCCFFYDDLYDDVVSGPMALVKVCWWRKHHKLCDGPDTSGWICCAPSSHVSHPDAPDSFDRHDPDPETCENIKKPPPVGVLKKPKIQSNEDPIQICYPRKEPSGTD